MRNELICMWNDKVRMLNASELGALVRSSGGVASAVSPAPGESVLGDGPKGPTGAMSLGLTLASGDALTVLFVDSDEVYVTEHDPSVCEVCAGPNYRDHYGK